ncbi:MAG TPA: hypothetical protein PKC18_18175, partial [Lacipirellulaceae bacterium]|nr:hypothetical protein [Lacipirellulaceae bacterium]
MLRQPLPPLVARELDAAGLNGVPVLLSTSTDLALSGQPRRHWIIANRDNVAAIADGQQPQIAAHVAVRDVAEFRLQGAVGSGFLQAYVDDHWVDLARYANADVDQFQRLVRGLEDLRTDGAVDLDEDAAAAPPPARHCGDCGGRLLTGGHCPRCVPRTAIVTRLARMLWPHRGSALAMCALMLTAVAAELAPPKLQQHLVDNILQGGAAAPDPHSLGSALLAVVLALAATRL